MPRYVIWQGEVLGRLCERLADVKSKRVFDVDACGAPGVLFKRRDFSYGVEEQSAVEIVEASNATAARRCWR